MRPPKFLNIFLFCVGFTIGVFLYLPFIGNSSQHITHKIENLIKNLNTTPGVLYEQELADKLFKEVKILCLLITHPANHKTKLPHVRNVWAKRCNKFVITSNKGDESQPDIVEIPYPDGRQVLWNKTKAAMKYVHDKYINDYDWFMKVDDDNYIIFENLRHMLYQYNPKTAIYIGSRFAGIHAGSDDGYMGGGGYVFSKKALQKFVYGIEHEKACKMHDGEYEDVFTGVCLRGRALFVVDNDENDEKRFFHYSFEDFMHKVMPIGWYTTWTWRGTKQGGLACCSDTFILQHYVPPQALYLFEYLVYNVHAFGIEKNVTETLPRKFSLEEIIESVDRPATTDKVPKDKKKTIHQLDEDEKY